MKSILSNYNNEYVIYTDASKMTMVQAAHITFQKPVFHTRSKLTVYVLSLLQKGMQSRLPLNEFQKTIWGTLLL